MSYNPKDWFWIVAGDTSRAWSSATTSYVTDYPLERVTRIASEAELGDVLAPHGKLGPSLPHAKSTAEALIDVAAGAARLRYITDAPGQDLTYDRKRREALQAIDDPAPTAQKYPVLAASIGIEVPVTNNTKTDFDAVCTLVISRETAWAVAASQIEALRLGGKQQVAVATSPAQIAETVSATETALKAL